MERKELYAKIQELNLQDEVKKTYGKNYTQVSNSDLEKLIWNYDASHTSGDPYEDEDRDEDKGVAVETSSNATSTESAYEAACLVFLGILKDSGKLDELLGKL